MKLANPRESKGRRKSLYLIVTGMMLGFVLVYGAKVGVDYTSTDVFCDKFCHAHPHSTQGWIRSTHYTTKSGVTAHCVDCHLPGGGIEYYTEKAKLGLHDAYGYLFKDLKKIDWEAKKTLEEALTFTYDSACVRCHTILFSSKLSKKGVDGHLHYQRAKDKLRCINCHLTVGHYRETKVEDAIETEAKLDMFDPKQFPPPAGEFRNYTETIPDSDVKFEMVAIKGGSFMMGSPESEPYRDADEGPRVKVQISPFWIGRTEVRWREWEAYYARNGAPGRENTGSEEAVETGPTPPYGSPDQGWGKGSRPAITMTHHAAMKYCEWLSKVTGKKYRLPTEAEWEYACRAGTDTPYPFPGDPSDFTALSWWNRIMGPDVEPLKQYSWYQVTAGKRTHLPTETKPNPWGLFNMLGNVREFCLDWYDPKAYASYGSEVVDPRGPESGTEHVVRGGSYRSDAADLRSAARDHTQHDAWLVTDPQSPKSIWWYSDCADVGFRVVREQGSAAAPIEQVSAQKMER